MKQHVLTVVGDVKVSEDGLCPYCKTALPTKDPTFCLNSRCDASYFWTPLELERDRLDRKKMQARRDFNRQQTEELQAMLDFSNKRKRDMLLKGTEEAVVQGYCGKCYELSDGRTKVKHRLGCSR